MKIFEYMSCIPQFLVLIPSALLCYMPMKNQLKYSPFKIFTILSGIFIVLIPICTLVTFVFRLDKNYILFPVLILLFPLYHSTLKTDLSRSLAVFLSICALMTFPAAFAYAFDARLHPFGFSSIVGWKAGLVQLGISCGIVFLTAYPMFRYGSYLIDNLNFSRIWFTLLPFPLIFLLFGFMIIPHKYETMYTNNLFFVYYSISFFMFIFQIFIYILFYHIAVAIISNANAKERIRFFEMQESQYLSQKKYIEQTEKLRHDFRQSLHTLKGLSDCEDWRAIKKYLEEYEKMLPKNEITKWCSNTAVNAILNYYVHTATSNGINLKWEIKLPPTLNISNPDLCSLLGNILENAIAGCMTVNEDKRYHCLSMTVKNKSNLYIVSINSFDGNVLIKENRYLSTKRKGSGIGINSVTMTAEKYGGIARFSHKGQEFSVDVMMMLKGSYEHKGS